MNKNALYFPDEDYFVSYVRSLSANMAGEFTLYHLAAFSTQTGGLILVGIDTTESSTLELQSVSIKRITHSSKTLKQAHKIIHFKDSNDSHKATVIGEVKKFYIMDLLTLHKAEQESTPNAYFWISDHTLLKQLITQSIRLGNDQIQFAELQSDNQTTHLVKIENPSYFLVQKALEDFDNNINVYYPIMDDVFIAWGYTHPLEDIWRKSKKPRQQWTFIDSHNQSRKVEPIQWTDIYEFLHFDLEIPDLHSSTLSSTDIEPLTIPLQLITTSNDADPSMWLIQGADLVNLESLLTVIDQDDLASYVVNISEDNNGEKLIFIREKNSKKNSLFIDFSAQSFANFKGFQNLYLPTQLEFQPNVRRDTYRHLFNLKAGENTVLLNKESPRIIKITDAGFRPLSRYVNYIIQQSLETLEAVIENSYFDLSIYTKLAKTGYSDSQPSTVKPLIENKPGNDSQDNANKNKDNKNQEKIRQLFDNTKNKNSNKNQTTESKQQFEIDAERNVIKDPSLEHWQALVRIKQSLRRNQDIENCIIALIWMLPPGKAQEYFLLWHEIVSQVIQDSSGKSDTTAAKALVLSVAHISEEGLSEWLHQSITALKSVEKNLKIKELWLLWHIILHKNHDTREQARLQENIRDAISQGTVDYIEIPEFIRTRIFTDRLIHTSNKDDYDVAIANGNLELFSSAILKFDKKFIRMSAAAIIARIYNREMNRPEPAIEILNKLSKNNPPPTTIDSVDTAKFLVQFIVACPANIQTWVGLYLLHSFPDTTALQNHYKKLLSDCDEPLKNKLGTLNDFLEQREKADNPLALLSEKNRNRYYPKGTIYETGPLAKATAKLRRAALTADKAKIKRALKSVLKNVKLNDDDMQLAQLITELTRLLNFIKMDDDSKPILESFIVFADKVAQTSGSDHLYRVLRQSNLAEGLIQIAHKKKASTALTGALEVLRTIHSELDFIDACSSIISAIECFDLKERATLIQALLEAINHYIKGDPHFNASLQADWLQLSDQIAEACISKDKLSMNLFNHYQQQDEFIILNRILHESIN
ncbi:hypothetical protein MNBD_GAMMA12-3889 [hydrothermal vent metagenome]|uniref:FtsH ternary system domain-containing protein n=1 Tax=hydrothermal vent metagenome TaxID=652676 RepID=A0A3B0ZBH1_9ZZZZ